MNLRWQNLHWYGVSPVWIRKCSLKFAFRPNRLLQCGHINASSVWTFWCDFKLQRCLYCLLQNWHLNFLDVGDNDDDDVEEVEDDNDNGVGVVISLDISILFSWSSGLMDGIAIDNGTGGGGQFVSFFSVYVYK